MSKTVSKYIATFDYFNKTLATSGGVSLYATGIGAPVGIIIADYSLVFSISNEVTKRLLKTMRKKKKKHNKIVLIARIKLNSIET